MNSLTPDELSIKYGQLSEAARADLCACLAKWAEVELPAAGDTRAPRRSNMTHRATGRLIFSCDSPDGEKLPLHHVRVELWDRDFGPDDFLGSATTDREGYFEVWYDPADAGLGDTPDLELRVFDWEHAYNSRRERELHYKLVATFASRDDVVSELFNFGELRVAYWEYDPQAVTPRILVPEHSNPPQSFPTGRAVVLLQRLVGIQLTKEKHWLQNKLDSQLPSLATIQADYPESLSMRIERERPGYTQSDEYFGERILNGMSASILDRDPANPDRLWLHYHWNSYAQDDVHAMPNVDVWFELRDGKPYPVEIGLQFRQRGHTEPNAPQEPMQRFTPADGERWLQAKRVARVSAALHAELDVHLCQTHLNTEQYALAAYRNLRLSPLRYLLHPHLKEVILINREANQRLLGEQGYITRATAFTAESLNQRIRQSVGTLDWQHWQPRRILSEHHQYARAAHLFWDMLIEYVHWFFEEHRPAIVEHWYEVYRFSRDLVIHSAPFFMCRFLRGHAAAHRGTADTPLGDWCDPSERLDVTIPRVVINGEEKAVQPITMSETHDEQGWENMQQVCRYAIFHATFAHTWSNSRQHDDGGELTYNGLGLRYGDHGVLSPESDASIAPPPTQASEQVWFAWLLSKGNYGFLMKNEERDIHPKLIELLRQRKDAFAALDVDIQTIQSRTNI